jgi:hypothetical protein
MNMFQLSFLLFFLFGRFGEDLIPLLLLLNLPSMFLPLLLRGAIIPKMKINIKRGGCDTTKIVNMKSDLLREDREAEVVVVEKFDMKIRSTTTQT